MQRALIISTLFIALLTMTAGSVFYSRIQRFWGITQTDFSVFYHAGYQLDRWESMYEQRPTHFTTNEEYLFKYAPPVGLAMIPLSRLPVQNAIRWWYALTAIALTGALWGVLQLTAPAHDTPRAAWIAGLLLLATLRPYLANLRLGQIDVILAGCLVGFLVALTRRREGVAGWWLGIPMLCKLVPAAWLAYLAIARRWRVMAWAVVAMAAYLASPIPHAGWAGTRRAVAEWVSTLFTSTGNYEWLVRYKNQSVLSMVLRLIGGTNAESISGNQVTLAVGVTAMLGLAYGWWIWKALQRHRDDADPLRALIAPSLTMIAMVIFSPHAWIATFIHLLLPYGVLITYLVTRVPQDRAGWAWLGSSFLLISGTASDLLGGGALASAIHRLAPLMWGALCLATGVWRIGKSVGVSR